MTEVHVGHAWLGLRDRLESAATRLVPRRARGPEPRGAPRGRAAVRPAPPRLRAARRGDGARAGRPLVRDAPRGRARASGPRSTAASSATGCSRRRRRYRWVPPLGGVVCGRCPGPPASGRRLSLDALKLLKAYQRLDIEAIAALRLARARRARGRGRDARLHADRPRARPALARVPRRGPGGPRTPAARRPAPARHAPTRLNPTRSPTEVPSGLRHRIGSRRPRAGAARGRHARLADDGHARRPAADLPDLVPVARRRDPDLRRPAGEAQRQPRAPTRGCRSTSTTTARATGSSCSRARPAIDASVPPVRTTTRPTTREVRATDPRPARLGRGDGVRLQRPAPDPPDPRRARSALERAGVAPRSRPARRSPARPRGRPAGARRGASRRVEARLNPVGPQPTSPRVRGRAARSTPRSGSRTSTRTRCCSGRDLLVRSTAGRTSTCRG